MLFQRMNIRTYNVKYIYIYTLPIIKFKENKCFFCAIRKYLRSIDVKILNENIVCREPIKM